MPTPDPGKSNPKKPRPTRTVYARNATTYPIETVLKLRASLAEALTTELVGRPLTPDRFAAVVDLVMEVIPKGVARPVLEDSLRHLAGTTADKAAVEALAWRMAGNYRRMKAGRAVPPWHGQTLPEWVPAQVVGCKREKNGRGKPGARLAFRVLAGTPAGLTAYKWWSLRMCRYLAPDFGYSKSRPNARRAARFPYAVPEQLVGLRANLRVTPALSGREPGFDEIRFNPAGRAWNATTVRCRFRVEPGFACKMNVGAAELPCQRCPVGFLKCRAGTHRQSWEVKDCPGCSRKSYFDPESASDVCVDCVVRASYAHK